MLIIRFVTGVFLIALGGLAHASDVNTASGSIERTQRYRDAGVLSQKVRFPKRP